MLSAAFLSKEFTAEVGMTGYAGGAGASISLLKKSKALKHLTRSRDNVRGTMLQRNIWEKKTATKQEGNGKENKKRHGFITARCLKRICPFLFQFSVEFPFSLKPDSACVHRCVLNCFSHVQLCAPVDCSLPGSSVHGIPQQEHGHGEPCPPPGELPDPGIKLMSPMSPALAGAFFTASATSEGQASQHFFKNAILHFLFITGHFNYFVIQSLFL